MKRGTIRSRGIKAALVEEAIGWCDDVLTVVSDPDLRVLDAIRALRDWVAGNRVDWAKLYLDLATDPVRGAGTQHTLSLMVQTLLMATANQVGFIDAIENVWSLRESSCRQVLAGKKARG